MEPSEATWRKIKSYKATIFNILFCIVAIGGQVGQNITLPLWLSSSTVKVGNCSSELDDTEQHMFGNNSGNNTCNSRSIDAYFVYTFACVSFVVIFGVMLVILKIIRPSSLSKKDLQHSQLMLFLIGFFDGFNGVLAVFASNPSRTAPYLQAILGNFTIPLTVVFRLFILRRKPSVIQAVCSGVVFLSIFLCLFPAFIPSLGGSTDGGAEGASGIIWALIFMFAFVPAAVMNVLEEAVLKKKTEKQKDNLQDINMIFFFFMTSCYQLLTAMGFFWADIIPWYGFSTSVTQLGQNWAFGASCFFGGEGCGSGSGIRGSMFIIFYTISYLGGGLLLRHSEGATFLAVVSALVTPIGFIFWTLFQPVPFEFHPAANNQTWFAIASVVLMFPAIFLYNYKGKEPQHEEKELLINNRMSGNYTKEVYIIS